MNSNLDQRVMTAGVVGAVGLFGLFFYLMSRRQRKEYQHVATISKLFLHPVKSLAGFEVQEGHVTNRGFMSNGIYDRSFMVVDEDHRFVTAGFVPKMVLIQTGFSKDGKHLVLRANGQLDMNVSLDQEPKDPIHSKVLGVSVTGIDCGDEVAEWLSVILEGSYRLIYYSEQLPGKKMREKKHFGQFVKGDEVSLFQNHTQFTMLSEASVADLNTRLEEQVTVTNFRPNIYVKDCSAFAEDFWKYIKIGNYAELHFVCFCTRCRATTVSRETGTITSEEPLKTMKEYRQCYDFAEGRAGYASRAIFSVMLNTETVGVIHVGDPVYAVLQFQEHIQK